MAKTGVIYNKLTGGIVQITTCSRDSDLVLNYKPETEAIIEIKPDHKIKSEKKNWHIDNGKLKRHTKAFITKREKEEKEKEAQGKEPEFLKSQDEIKDEVILDIINEVRGKQDLPPLTEAQFKEVIDVKKEQYRNPKKII